MPALEARGITHRYGTRAHVITALDSVSLSVDPGEFVAVLGPSGSGKTTLLSILGCVLTPTGGQLEVAGTRVAGLRPRALTELRARQIGFVFQAGNLIPYLTARENLEVVGGLLAGNPGRPTLRHRATELLEQLGVAHRGDHLPATLSAGERQRVALARALLNEPSVLLADEPTASLDTDQGDAVVALLAHQASLRRVATVMVTHDLRMAARADRQIHLRDGSIVPATPPEPATPT